MGVGMSLSIRTGMGHSVELDLDCGVDIRAGVQLGLKCGDGIGQGSKPSRGSVGQVCELSGGFDGADAG